MFGGDATEHTAIPTYIPTLDAVPFVMLFCSHIRTGLLAQWQSIRLLIGRFRVRLPGSPLLHNSYSIHLGCYVDSYPILIPFNCFLPSKMVLYK